MVYLLVDARDRYAGAARPRARGTHGGNPKKKAAEAANVSVNAVTDQSETKQKWAEMR